MIDLDQAPVITRRWWIAGHILLVPPVRWLLRLRVVGQEHIPATGAVLIVSNHISQVDPPILGVAVLPRKSHYMAKAELFRIPLAATDRSTGWGPSRSSAAAPTGGRCGSPATSCERGDVLLMFPEGTRYTDGVPAPGHARRGLARPGAGPDRRARRRSGAATGSSAG